MNKSPQLIHHYSTLTFHGKAHAGQVARRHAKRSVPLQIKHVRTVSRPVAPFLDPPRLLPNNFFFFRLLSLDRQMRVRNTLEEQQDC